MIKNWFRNMGPGTLVAAAFIGPGTVTVCTLAGAHFGFTLLWAMVLSIIATLVLQEMAARLGIISQRGLSEVIRTAISNPLLKKMVILLILAAIVIGNAAYEAGNISGGILGLETLTGTATVKMGGIAVNYLSVVVGIIAFVLLYIGNYKVLERVLISLVILMSISFLATAIITKPDLTGVLKGSLIPSFPENSILTIIGLIGTTVVPYNLFLHASLVKEKWGSGDLTKARQDTYISIVLGGIVSMAIIVSGAAIQSPEIANATDLARGLTPLYGNFSKYFLGIGLFSAGITSAITAPLAAAYVAEGCLNWKGGLRSTPFRAVWILILLTGIVFSSIGFKPIEIIKFAQVANGLLLPVIAIILLWIMNESHILGSYKNTVIQNSLAVLIIIVSLFLGIKSILKVFELIG